MGVLEQWLLTALLGIIGRMVADYVGRRVAEWAKTPSQPAVARRQEGLSAARGGAQEAGAGGSTPPDAAASETGSETAPWQGADVTRYEPGPDDPEGGMG